MWYSSWGRIVLFCLSIALLVLPVTAHAQTKVYWTDASLVPKIQRSNLDGSNYEVVVDYLELLVDGEGPWLQGLEVDPVNQKLYWVGSYGGIGISRIERVNLDGTGREPLVISGLTFVRSLALDLVNQKMYWTHSDKVQRANLDGTGVETLIASVEGREGIGLDVPRGKMYWAEGGAIKRANLDGSNVVTVIQSDGYMMGLDFDPVGARIYWAWFDEGLYSANSNGGDVQLLVPVSGHPILDVKVDTAQRKLYWADFSDGIGRSDLDGTNVENIVGSGATLSLAIDSPAAIVTLPVASSHGLALVMLALGLCGAGVLSRRQRQSA